MYLKMQLIKDKYKGTFDQQSKRKFGDWYQPVYKNPKKGGYLSLFYP